MQSSFRFVALALALSACGCGGQRALPPPIPRQVTLEILGPTTTPQSGYIPTYGSNGKMYLYRYSGGNDHGNIKVSLAEGHDVIIQIVLNGASNFIIEAIPFTDNDGQLSSHIEPNEVRAQIHDTNERALNAYYALQIKDKTAGSDIYCDPGIINN